MKIVLDKWFIWLYKFKVKYSKQLMIILIFLIVPGVTGFLLGYEMENNRIDNIPTIIVDHDNSEFSRQMVSYFSQNDILNVIEYAEADQRIQDMISSGKAMTGIIIPEGLSSDIKEGNAPKIMAIYDGSMMSVASASKSAVSEILLIMKAGYLENIYEGKLDAVPSQAENYIRPIDVTYRTLFNPAKNYRNFILPGMLVALIQVGMAIIGVERARERKDNYLVAVSRITIWGIFGAISIVLCLGIQYLFFGMPYQGSIIAGIILTILFGICMTGFGYIIGSIVPDAVFATQLTCVLVLPTSILGGYTFPLIAMPVFWQHVGEFIPFSYYGQAVRDLCMKEMSIKYFASDIFVLLAFIAAEWGFLLLIKLLEKKYAVEIS